VKCNLKPCLKCVVAVLAIFLVNTNSLATPSIELKQSAGPLLPSAGSNFSWYISYDIAGDFNGDGYIDFVLADPTASSNRGKLYYFQTSSNGTLATSPTATVTGVLGDFNMGYEIDKGDLNKDGVDDLIVGNPWYGNQTTGAQGRIEIYYGGDSLLNGIDAILQGEFGKMDSLGYANKVLDFNMDGNLDIIGFSRSYTNPTLTGRLSLYLGPIQNFQSPSSTYVFPEVGSFSGSYGELQITNANEDAYPDIVIGQPYDGTLYSNAGALGVFYGNSSGVLSRDARYFGPSAGAIYTWLVNKARDFFGHGTDGILATGTGETSFRLYKSTDLSTLERTYTQENAADGYGRHALGIGDLDNDGYGEMLIGAWGYASNARKGKVYLYQGGTSSPASPFWTNLGQSNLDRYSIPIDVGDFEGDGWGDFGVVAYGYSAGASKAKLYLYSVTHGTPTIDLSNNDVIETGRLTGTATDTNVAFTVSGIQWNTSNTTYGAWTACTADDGTFDSGTEKFTCDVSSLGDNIGTIYVRSYDQNTVYMPTNLFALYPNKLDSELELGLNKQDRYEVGDTTIYTNQHRIKLYFDTSNNTTKAKYIKIAQHQDFSDANWQEYDSDMWIHLSSGDEKKRLYIRLKDRAGNESDTFEQLIKVDTTPPNLSISKIGTFEPNFEIYKDYFYTEQNPTIIGHTEKSAILDINVDGKITVNEETGEFNLNPTSLGVGKHEILITSEDKAGNKSALAFNLNIDPTATSFPQSLGIATQSLGPANNPEEQRQVSYTKEELKPQVQGIQTKDEQVKKPLWQTMLGWFGIKY